MASCLDRPPRPRGYTLLELIIVLALIGAMAALSLPAMRGPMDKSELRGAAKELCNRLALARLEVVADDQSTFDQSVHQLDELFLLVVVGEFNAGKPAEPPPWLHVSLLPVRLPEPRQSAFIRLVERQILWGFVNRWERLPACNSR